MKKSIISIVLAFSLIVGIIGGYGITKPAQRPKGENEAYHSIIADVTEITSAIHTAGSPENYAVRNMIVDRVKELGLVLDIFPFTLDVPEYVKSATEGYNTGSTAYKKRIDGYVAQGNHASVEEYNLYKLNAAGADTLNLDNVLVKVSGTAPKGSVMFVSHYDHVMGAPGAADDALAVACMLNLMEDMAKNPPQNDVYFLYTDGEELGLLGAADFVKTQPQYAQEVDVLFNFEARGNRGTMVMFETSGNDYELVRHFKDAVPQPMTMSVATAVYETMPNGTDYTRFKDAGYHGLNFAMVEGDENYHQPTDTVENLNKDSAWQYYQNITALGSYFGGVDLTTIQNDQKAIYFPLPLVGIVVLPAPMAYALGFVPLVLAIILIVMTLQKKQKRKKRSTGRIIGIALLGILPAVLTIYFFPGNYLFAVPALLFLIADLSMELTGQKSLWLSLILTAFAVLITACLFVPVVVLIQVALKFWYITALMAILPFIPILLYTGKLCRMCTAQKRMYPQI